jgi:hypothetical protein
MPSLETTVLPDIGSVMKLVEWAIRHFPSEGGVEIGPPARRSLSELAEERLRQWIQRMAESAQSAEHLDDASVPTGDVGDQFFEDSDCSFPAAIVDSFGHVHTAAPFVEGGDKPGRYKIADVWDGPVVAALDKRVLPETFVAAPRVREVLGDDGNQRSQNAGLRSESILFSIDGREPIPEPLDIVFDELIARGHHSTPPLRIKPPAAKSK